MLGMGSQTARNIRRPTRGGAAMDSIFNGRSQRSDDRMRARESAYIRNMMRDQQKSDRARDNRDERQETVSRLTNNRDNRKVIGLLEKIANKLDGLDRGGGGIGNIIAGGLLGRMLARAGFGGSKGMTRSANGRWRDASGRFTAGPERSKFGKAVDGFRNTRVGRGMSAMGNAVGNSRFGRVAKAVARPAGAAAGRLARSPVGRIAGNAARIGGNILGKVALPVAAGMALYSGVHGMRNADEILGRKTNLKDKTAVGVSEVVNSALLGIPGWVSKHVFGMSFSKLMVDGLDDVGKKIQGVVSGAFTKAKDLIGSTIGSVGAYFSTAFESVSNYVKEIQTVGGELVDAVKRADAFGAAAALGKIGKLLFKGAVAAPVAVGKAAADVAVTGGKVLAKGAAVAGEYVGEKARQVGSAVTGAVGKVAAWAGLGSTSAKYESGSRGVHAISSGKGDPGGASYGKYQLASKTGTLQKYLKDSGYGSQFAGMQPGSKEFNAKWKELANSDPKFGETQHEFIKKTHFDPAAAHAGKIGFNMQNKGVQDAVWSASVQHGGVKKLLSQAAKTPGWDKMTDEQKLQRFYQVRTEYATSAMARNGASQSQIEGVRSRYTREVNDVTALSKQGGAMAAGSQTAAATNLVDPNATPQPRRVASAEGVIVRQGTPTRPPAGRPAAYATPQHPPLIEDLPEPVSSKPVVPVIKPAAQSSGQPAGQPQQRTSSSGGQSSGRGGMPSVNDVADRPRIDLQPIVTTLNPR